ncbi:cobalt-precorrin-8X methylmutase [Spirulina sp. CS-785/01]|nr:cobalt-precorrin-8X methylmutase [Spirulina sp. CS-785/01]MDB9312609.1 cobalt-precorrin-8X methylmutase [Spirulina sp. CS-785/01]
MTPDHPIVQESFAIIDREIGEHSFNDAEYTIIRRIIHTTADFDYKHLVQFSPDAIDAGLRALRQKTPIIVDVTMVRQGIANKVAQTYQNPIITAIDSGNSPLPGKTRTETGLIRCFEKYPHGIYVIGNAPTALSALCQLIPQTLHPPALVIGVPVGFVNVVESKQQLATLRIPQIRISGRKGGSSVAAAIINAFLTMEN